MGWCDRATVYFAGLAAQLPRLHPASFASQTRPGLVEWAQARLALQYRSGTLLTAKRLHRFGYRNTDLCLTGCGQPDSIHHAVSTCGAVLDARTARHNGACLILARALQHSDKEGLRIHSADVGGAEALGKRGIRSSVPKRIGGALLPRNLSPSRHRALSDLKPDIVMVEPGTRPGARTVHLVEVKYARDTRPEEQEARAHAQYAELARELQQVPGQRVQTHSIVLGIGGAIFNTTAETLAALGLQGKAGRAVMVDLHKHAVVSLHAIWRGRHSRIRAAGQLRTRPKRGGDTALERPAKRRRRSKPEGVT